MMISAGKMEETEQHGSFNAIKELLNMWKGNLGNFGSLIYQSIVDDPSDCHVRIVLV